MPRFMLNRWWTLILALSISVAGVASLSRTSLADPVDQGGKGVGDSGSGDINPSPGINPEGAGDPDSPSPTGRASSIKSNGGAGYGRIGPMGISGAGDAVAPGKVQLWLRVRLAMGLLKYYYLRF